MKEVKMYEAKDGKLFKTKKGAENHDKKLLIKEIEKELNMTTEEIQSKLEKASDWLPGIAKLIKYSGSWTNWAPHQIRQIYQYLLKNAELLDGNVKRTEYVMEEEGILGNPNKETILFTETGSEFTDPELHCEDEYKMVKVEDVNSITKKVYYDYKYTWEERLARKLKEGNTLSESDINDILWSFPQVYEEEGEEGRWTKAMLTVIDVKGDLYAIQWEKGLTEAQPNGFYTQPYLVELKEEKVTITKTIVIKKENSN